MTDTGMCFADLSSGDEFESSQYSCADSKRYLKLSVTFQKGIADDANAVEMNTGDPASFEPEDRITLVRSASERRAQTLSPRKNCRRGGQLRSTRGARNAANSILRQSPLKAASIRPARILSYKYRRRPTGEKERISTRTARPRVNKQPLIADQVIDQRLVAELTNRGVIQSEAAKIVPGLDLGPDEHLTDILDRGDYLIQPGTTRQDLQAIGVLHPPHQGTGISAHDL